MTTPPRVLEVIFGNTLGGAEVLLREVLRAATPGRFEWHLCLLRKRAPWDEFIRLQSECDFRLHHVHCSRALDPLCLMRLTRLMREQRFDVVHTHLFRADFHARWAARRAGVPVVVSTVHNFERFLDSWIWNRLARWSARQADRILGCTESVAEDARLKLGLPESQVMAIPNGTPLEPFLREQCTDPVRQEFRIPAGHRVVGTIGRLSEQKNHGDFLAMAKAVLATRPDTHFLLVGDGPLRGDLERRATELGIADQVIFTGPRRDIPALIALMDVFVLSSLWEGLPITVLEAMAAGTPCVTTDVGGCRDIVRSGETGWLVPPRQPEALASAVLEALADEAATRSIAERARERVKSNHSVEVYTQRHEELFEALLRDKRVA